MTRKTTTPDLRDILSGNKPANTGSTKEPATATPIKENKERKERNLSTEKVKFTTGLDPSTLERLRDAAWWSRDPVAAIVERAILEEIKRMEKAHGESFPQRREELRPGRPVK
jgi:hypothetical protein